MFLSVVFVNPALVSLHISATWQVDPWHLNNNWHTNERAKDKFCPFESSFRFAANTELVFFDIGVGDDTAIFMIFVEDCIWRYQELCKY